MARTDPTPEQIKAHIKATFNAAAPHFDGVAGDFWARLGRRAVALAGVNQGDRVLDVCCGTGASALPAAQAAGPDGWVLGLDFAEDLLGLARAKAAAQGIANVDFRTGDLTALAVPAGSFDAVLCVLGVFFAPDLPGALGGLWRAVRPGGTLAITTWGERVMEPASTLYGQAIASVRPDLVMTDRPWARIGTPGLVAECFAEAGVAVGGGGVPEVLEEEWRFPVTGDDFWKTVVGSGYRSVLDRMGPEAAARVHDDFLARAAGSGLTEVTSDLLFIRARKPSD